LATLLKKLSAVGNGIKNFLRRRSQRLKYFSDVGDSARSTKWRFSSLNLNFLNKNAQRSL
jgi:hypothetical protein